jgi:hypothetical protein
MRPKRVRDNPKENRRSLHYATPDFLLSLVALAIVMRLSLKAAHVTMSSAAWQEIRVRSSRDDNSVAAQISYFSWKRRILSSNRIVISTERSVVERSAVFFWVVTHPLWPLRYVFPIGSGELSAAPFVERLSPREAYPEAEQPRRLFTS